MEQFNYLLEKCIKEPKMERFSSPYYLEIKIYIVRMKEEILALITIFYYSKWLRRPRYRPRNGRFELSMIFKIHINDNKSRKLKLSGSSAG